MYRWLFWLCAVLAIVPLTAIPWSDRPFVLALQSSVFVGLARLCSQRRRARET
ncbi:hypothetical protein OG897_08085 [Streptomyces sp. NBC_00237]|uniref:hypothetical protein n=1 Tax=Streptomyces sp. NBC_00237 TaxID=2975687 RepID=UPI002253FCCF|nr:hypothetical protein [Streptomyces sp. NBC_00237]MCX5201410.1 hypothetical protein [Streptomyces sp. NBC_00237]